MKFPFDAVFLCLDTSFFEYQLLFIMLNQFINFSSTCEYVHTFKLSSILFCLYLFFYYSFPICIFWHYIFFSKNFVNQKNTFLVNIFSARSSIISSHCRLCPFLFHLIDFSDLEKKASVDINFYSNYLFLVYLQF